jgi:hypothetical protein
MTITEVAQAYMVCREPVGAMPETKPGACESCGRMVEPLWVWPDQSFSVCSDCWPVQEPVSA